MTKRGCSERTRVPSEMGEREKAPRKPARVVVMWYKGSEEVDGGVEGAVGGAGDMMMRTSEVEERKRGAAEKVEGYHLQSLRAAADIEQKLGMQRAFWILAL